MDTEVELGHALDHLVVRNDPFVRPCPVGNAACTRGDGLILTPRIDAPNAPDLASHCDCWWRTAYISNLKKSGVPANFLTWDAEFTFEAARRHLEAEIHLDLDEVKESRIEAHLTRYGRELGKMLRDSEHHIPAAKGKRVRSLALTTPDKRLGTYIAVWLAGRAKQGYGADWNVLYYKWSDLISILSTYSRQDDHAELVEEWRDAECVIVDGIRPVDLAGKGPLKLNLETLLDIRHSRDLVTIMVTSERNPAATINLEVWHEWLVAAGGISIPLKSSTADLAAEGIELDGVDEILADAEDDASRWVYPNLVVEGGITVVHGASGTGKSFLALEAGLAASNPERRFLGLYGVTQPISVLYLDEDSNNAAEFNARVKAMGVGEAERDRFFRSSCKGLKIDNADDLRKIQSACASKGIRLLILDSLKTLHSKNEQDNNDMRAVMDNLKVFTRVGISVLLIHHDGKAGEDGSLGLRQWRARGASAIIDACDLSLALTQDTEVEGTILLRPGKRRSKNSLKEIRYRVVVEDGITRLQGKARLTGESSDYNSLVTKDDLDARIVDFLGSVEGGEAATAVIKKSVQGDNNRIHVCLTELVEQGRLEKRKVGNALLFRLV